MPGYVSNVLSKFQHDAPNHPQHTPSRYVTPVYGANTQYAMKDETPPLTAQQCLKIQKFTGYVLYYARAVDPTVLMPLNDIATEQTKATEKTQAATNQLLDYLATHQLTYQFPPHEAASEVCSSCETNPPKQDTLNRSILNVASVIKNVVASEAKSEVGACFHNAQSGAPLRVTLTKLGHQQPPTHLHTENSTAFGILNGTIKQKRSKAMDIRFHWLTDRVRQKQFVIITKNIIQRNITNKCTDSYYIKQKVFRLFEDVLNYSHSHNPRCAPARTHGQIQAPREPPH
jgi:hypothetical protein